MRVSIPHYEYIKECILALSIEKIEAYQTECKSKNFSQTRFVWDLFHFSNACRNDICQTREFRAYLDSHLDTAITKAVKEMLGKNYKY